MDNKKLIDKMLKTAEKLCQHGAELFPDREQKEQRQLYLDGVINASGAILLDLMKSGIISEEKMYEIARTYGLSAYKYKEIN